MVAKGRDCSNLFRAEKPELGFPTVPNLIPMIPVQSEESSESKLASSQHKKSK